ncbi:hypothetical protein B0H66DRAFT_613422 [Apodospora peruviana]|uniref:Uncharacterized protein n=1 Tax=Apodospora peruviana TaxID=516989 RepID=A0AAE0HRY1_9PEZI|nr:hypothetical protein B0H66DRAFT_618315 [Apodospora peruviana]KAK3331234.1 hypothetical protein B0H66DRAFT_613422 [Apodospora peruviana]
MGFIGCSMAENVAQGYVAVGGMVMQSWTSTTSAEQVAKYGKPDTYPTLSGCRCPCSRTPGAKYDEVRQLIAKARRHAAPGAAIYITDQPVYEGDSTGTLAGANGPELTESLAKQAAADASLNVTYPGQLLKEDEVANGCHANTAGQASLGKQGVAFWG